MDEILVVADLVAALERYDGDVRLAVAQQQPDGPVAAVPVALVEWGGRVWLTVQAAEVDGNRFAPDEVWV